MSSRSPVAVLKQADAGIRRAALRRKLQAVTTRMSRTLTVDLDHAGVDVGEVIEQVTEGLPMESAEMQRLVAAFKDSGVADRVIARLSAKSPVQRARSARVIGARKLGDAPVVGERDVAPGRVGEIGFLRAGGVAFQEMPAGVEGLRLANRRRDARGLW